MDLVVFDRSVHCLFDLPPRFLSDPCSPWFGFVGTCVIGCALTDRIVVEVVGGAGVGNSLVAKNTVGDRVVGCWKILSTFYFFFNLK